MIPVELITMAGGAAMGGLFKFMNAAQKNRAEQQKLLIERNKAEQEVKSKDRKSATESANAAAQRVNDPFSKLTRRIFVITMLFLGGWAMMGALTGLDIVVPVTQETGFNLLGIIDTKKTVTEFFRFENAIVHFEWLKISILAAGSFYLGKS